MKPRHGSGGKGIVLLHNQRDFDYWQEKIGAEFMVQRLVGSDDQEYTVSVFGFGDGAATEPAIMRRRLGPDGATWWAESRPFTRAHSGVESGRADKLPVSIA